MHPLPDLGFFLGWNGATGIINKVSLKLFPYKKIRDNDVFAVENEDLVPEILYDLSHVGLSEDLISTSSAIPPVMDRLHHISIMIAGDYEEEVEFKRHMILDVTLGKYICKGVGGIVAVSQNRLRPQISKSADWKKGGGFEYVGAIMPASGWRVTPTAVGSGSSWPG